MAVEGARWSGATLPRNFAPFVAAPATGAGFPSLKPGTELPSLKLGTAQKPGGNDQEADQKPGGNEPQPAQCALLRVERGETPALAGAEPLSTSYNDLGAASLYDAGSVWAVALIPEPGEAPRVMMMRKDFSEATVYLRDDDPRYDFVMDSMTRIFFSQHAATRRALMLHASVVELGGKGYIFMGGSGIGKSTHSRLWVANFAGCRLLNDDCPLVVAGAEGFRVAGTPWSGKTRCFRNASCPVGGIARLSQAPRNRFTRLDGIEAFVNFIPGMSVMTSARGLYSEATSTALELLATVPVGTLECRPDREAAQTARTGLVGAQ